MVNVSSATAINKTLHRYSEARARHECVLTIYRLYVFYGSVKYHIINVSMEQTWTENRKITLYLV